MKWHQNIQWSYIAECLMVEFDVAEDYMAGVGVTWPHNFVKVSISDTRLALNEQLSTSINM